MRKIYLLFTLLVMGLGIAHADAISPTALTISNFEANGPTYATVSWSYIGNGQIDVLVQAAPNYGIFGNGGAAFGFNLVNPDNQLAFTMVTAGLSVGANPCSATCTMDGFGSFEYTVNSGPASQAVSSIEFYISDGSRFTSSTDLSHVFDANASGHDFAAHVINQASTTYPNTGYVTDGTPPTQTPEPGSMFLFGSALAGFAGLIRKRSNR